MASCSASELLDSGKCFQCLTKKELQIVIAQLLCEISAGGGGGGANQISRGSGPPVAAPADPTKGAMYYDDDSGSPSYDTSWNWSVPGQFWIGA